ncbi:MAG: nucleotidyl transferase AbiEii/AbiGii toxin family protein [Christensenellales bacterium]|jgi:predicted nucleotidyltransferase component of viral defense system
MINLSPKHISQIADETNYIKDNVEKVLRLLDILDYIYKTPLLQEKLVLKGGTAINLCYTDIPRLSVDIDFDYIGETKEEMLEDREILQQFLERSLFQKNYSLSARGSKNYHALSSQVYQYFNNAGNKDNIKLEINYLNRNHILPYNKLEVNNSICACETKLTVLNEYELYGSKMAALIARCKPRDIYDIYGMISANKLSDIDLLRKCTIFYNCISGQANILNIHPDNMFQEVSKNDFKRFLWPMLKKEDRFDERNAIDEIKDFMSNSLFTFTNAEIEFVDAFRRNDYYPDLLFTDFDILNRIEEHPAALWRTGRDSFIANARDR